MGTPGYATREVVKAALDNGGGSLSDAQIDRLIGTVSREIDLRMHRTFYPWQGTHRFDWPASSGANARMPAWVLELGNRELIELDALTTAGETVALDQVLLEPVNDGPPYTRIELNRGGPAAFYSGDTPQQSVAVTGLFGYRNDETRLTSTAGAIDADTTVVHVDAAAGIGTGSLLRLGDERVLVTGRAWIDTGATITAPLADRANDAVLFLSSATGIMPGELLAVGTERMLVTDVVGSAAAVRRAVGGSQLADHADNAPVYAQRALLIERGVCGTTAASHADGADVYRFDYPAPIVTLCVEEVLALLGQESAGMARVVGSEGAERETSARGLGDARRQSDVYRRRNRNRAV